MNIYLESPMDHEAVYAILRRAFADKDYSRFQEETVVKALRQVKAIKNAYVAEVDNNLVGYLALSEVSINGNDFDMTWYGVGPMAVLPEYQRQGIGSALINRILFQLRQTDIGGLILVGDHGYFKRFGFQPSNSMVAQGIPQESILIYPFRKTLPVGELWFHSAFYLQN